MTSIETQEMKLFDPTDFDSESSSSDERNARKRFGSDLETTGHKKRRKQSTPVRFPTSLMTSNRNGSEEDEEDDNVEGKTNSPQTKLLIPKATTINENLETEFQCHYCNRCFNDKFALNQHLDYEHYVTNLPSELSQQQGLSHNELSQSTKVQNSIKIEPDVATQQPNESASPVNLSAISVKNFATTWTPRCLDLVDDVQMQSQTLSQSQNDEWPSSTPNNMSLSDHIQGIPPFSGTLTQYLHYSGFPLPDSSHIPRSSVGSAPPRIFNRDAYCDLCNKEFCNKYFLKTHKANKHGIYSDSSSQSAASDTAVTSSIFTGSFPLSNVTLETQHQRSDSNATSPFAGSPMSNVPYDISQKRFKTEDLVKKHKQTIHEEPSDLPDCQTVQSINIEEKKDISRQSPSVMEMLFKQEYGIEQEDTSFMPAPRHLSPQAMQQAKDSGFDIDRLRRLGVINPEAFCEICCKEYCNKYFLRTHKMKRHGILIQDNDISPTTTGPQITWHQVQTSPLNLIVNETGNDSESGDRSEDEHECKPCGIRFQNVDLFLTHCQKFHETEKLKSSENEIESPNNKSDSISEDLQKLQTMILQLNDLESNKEIICAICNKDFESKIALQTHVSSEHDITTEDPSTPLQEIDKSPTRNINYCTLCEKEYANQDSLRRHVAEDHQPSTPTSLTSSQVSAASISTTLKTTPSQSERKAPTSMTPTSSYCEICNKELCNKYFMKTHMHRMHGIEISNGAQIGGVICNICNKELCSKYFLRVHKHNTHGIVDESAIGPVKQETIDVSHVEDIALKPEFPSDLSNRYFTHFTEVCPICSRRFRSVKWLKAHLLGDHGKAGINKWREYEEQYPIMRVGNRTLTTSRSSQSSPGLKIPNGQEIVQQQNKVGEFATLGTQVLSNLFGSPTDDQRVKSYRCSFCNFTTSALPFLFLHERSHVNPQGSAVVEGNQSLQCPICSQLFPKPELLHHHLLANHQFPSVLSQFQSPILGNLRLDVFAEKSKESKDKAVDDSKTEKRQENLQVFGKETEICKTPKTDITAVQVTAQGAYKCAQCGFATANLNRIKKHVKKDHKSIGDITDSVIAELSSALKDVANKHKMPASYAMPQDMNSNPDKTIMQPFLIEEYEVALHGGDEYGSMKRFAPALVYLPVKTRVNTALTASFTLSPA